VKDKTASLLGYQANLHFNKHASLGSGKEQALTVYNIIEGQGCKFVRLTSKFQLILAYTLVAADQG